MRSRRKKWCVLFLVIIFLFTSSWFKQSLVYKKIIYLRNTLHRVSTAQELFRWLNVLNVFTNYLMLDSRNSNYSNKAGCFLLIKYFIFLKAMVLCCIALTIRPKIWDKVKITTEIQQRSFRLTYILKCMFTFSAKQQFTLRAAFSQLRRSQKQAG